MSLASECFGWFPVHHASGFWLLKCFVETDLPAVWSLVPPVTLRMKMSVVKTFFLKRAEQVDDIL